LNLVSDHEHVAELYDAYEDEKAVHMVLELCKGGELFDRIISKGTFSERMAAGGHIALSLQ
jgi:calcium-dependent protein kinase